jgi:hypothetical protein
MNKYTVTIVLEVEVVSISETSAHDHALECVDEYDGDTKIKELDVTSIELIETECQLCGDWFEPIPEWVGLCDECIEKEDN